MTMLQAASCPQSTLVTGGILLYRCVLPPISAAMILSAIFTPHRALPNISRETSLTSYWLNLFYPQLMVKRGDRRAPEINLGYYARVAGVRLVMMDDLSEILRNTEVVLLATHAR